MAQDLRNKHLTKSIMDVLIWDFFLGGGGQPIHLIHSSAIFDF